MQATLAVTTEQKDCSWALIIQVDDEYQAAKQARYVDQRCLKPMHLSREMTKSMVIVGMAMDKAVFNVSIM